MQNFNIQDTVLKASELRIGNRVNLYKTAELKDVFENCVITEILTDSVKVEKFDNVFPLRMLQPIYLTEEWLLRAGFEYSKEYTFHGWFSPEINSERVRLYQIGQEFGFNPNTSKSIKLFYLHQLQNLYFTLSGQDLEFKQLTPKPSQSLYSFLEDDKEKKPIYGVITVDKYQSRAFDQFYKKLPRVGNEGQIIIEKTTVVVDGTEYPFTFTLEWDEIHWVVTKISKGI